VTKPARDRRGASQRFFRRHVWAWRTGCAKVRSLVLLVHISYMKVDDPANSKRPCRSPELLRRSSPARHPLASPPARRLFGGKETGKRGTDSSLGAKRLLTSAARLWRSDRCPHRSPTYIQALSAHVLSAPIRPACPNPGTPAGWLAAPAPDRADDAASLDHVLKA